MRDFVAARGEKSDSPHEDCWKTGKKIRKIMRKMLMKAVGRGIMDSDQIGRFFHGAL